MRSRPNRRTAGFTLIELMIAVAVVAILAAIAYPNYTEHVRKGRRAEAKAAMGDAANRLERCFTRFNSYAAAECAGVGSGATENGYYALSISATARSFTLTATPQNAQADDACGAFTLTHTGVRGLSVTPPAGKVCW